MKNKIRLKSILAVTLSLTIVLTSANFQGNVLAAESTEEQIVYVDGNEISVSVNPETGTIVAQSTDRNDDSY
ncbi:MAG: hypothetical protein ACRC7V_11060 [Lachnospiraceae bacterium]